MILSKKSLLRLKPVTPFIPDKQIVNGMSYGCSEASYDVRIGKPVCIHPSMFKLAVTLEEFNMPINVAGQVLDKSTWARRGLSCFNTFIDPGFKGFMTLELLNVGYKELFIETGDPICQIVFFWVDEDTEGYKGKYQDQPKEPVPAISEQLEFEFGHKPYEIFRKEVDNGNGR